MSDESLCLDAPTATNDNEEESTVRYQACIDIERQIWLFDQATSNLIHTASGKCLTNPTAGTSDIINLKVCKSGSPEQMWVLQREKWKDF